MTTPPSPPVAITKNCYLLPLGSSPNKNINKDEVALTSGWSNECLLSVPNFSSLASLEVAEKFVCVWVGGVAHMATMFSLNPSYLYIYIHMDFILSKLL